MNKPESVVHPPFIAAAALVLMARWVDFLSPTTLRAAIQLGLKLNGRAWLRGQRFDPTAPGAAGLQLAQISGVLLEPESLITPHFLDCQLDRHLLLDDPVSADHHAGPILAGPAMQ